MTQNIKTLPWQLAEVSHNSNLSNIFRKWSFGKILLTVWELLIGGTSVNLRHFRQGAGPEARGIPRGRLENGGASTRTGAKMTRSTKSSVPATWALRLSSSSSDRGRTWGWSCPIGIRGSLSLFRDRGLKGVTSCASATGSSPLMVWTMDVGEYTRTRTRFIK